MRSKDEWVFVPASSSSAPAPSGALGIQTKFLSTRVIPSFSADLEKKEQRFKLQEKGKKYAPQAKGFFRFKRCWKQVIFGKEVELRKNAEGKVRIRGVEQCGDVWACPVCAPRIQYQRGQEIKQAVDKAYAEGLKVYMLHETDAENARQLIESMAAEVEKHRDGAEPSDDLTMMAIYLK